jgi:hypothetical protein
MDVQIFPIFFKSKNLNINMDKKIYLLFYMCVKLGLTPYRKNIDSVLENKVLKRIFGPKRVEVLTGWKIMHNKELHKLYSSLNITSVIKTK